MICQIEMRHSVNMQMLYGCTSLPTENVDEIKILLILNFSSDFARCEKQKIYFGTYVFATAVYSF